MKQQIRVFPVVVFLLVLVSCGQFMSKHIPAQEANGATPGYQPAQPVSALIVPKQIEGNSHKQRAYYHTDGKREFRDRKDLLLPPNNTFSQ